MHMFSLPVQPCDIAEHFKSSLLAECYLFCVNLIPCCTVTALHQRKDIKGTKDSFPRCSSAFRNHHYFSIVQENSVYKTAIRTTLGATIDTIQYNTIGSLGSPIIITVKFDLHNNKVFVINWNYQPCLVTVDGQL